MKNKATAVVDIDGVLANFEQAGCEAFGFKNRHLYNFEERYPHLDPGLIAEWVNSEDNYLNLSPIFGGLLLIQQLKQRGFDVVLMTSRGRHLEAVTKSWLTLYHIEPYNLIFRGDKAESIKYYNDNEVMYYGKPITLFVDDSVSQLEQVKKLNPSVTCLAYDQPWNQGYYPRIRYSDKNQVYRMEGNNGDGKWKSLWEK